MLFDLGEPSESSGNLAAMIAIELEGGFVSSARGSNRLKEAVKHAQDS